MSIVLLGITRLRAPKSITICAHLSRFSKSQDSNFHSFWDASVDAPLVPETESTTQVSQRIQVILRA